MTYSHAFTVGDFKCTVISDGLREADWQGLHAFFPTMPRGEFTDVFKARYGEIAEHSLNLLLVQTEDRMILIDTGEGVNQQKPEIGKLLPALQSIDVAPEEIDTIVLTHAHGDHINGLTGDDGNLNFPNANYIMHEQEWQTTMGAGGTARGLDQFAKQMFAKLALIEEKLTLVKNGDTIIPGITCFDAFGHTRGHMVVLLQSNGESLLFLADTLLFELQLDHLHWCPRFDNDQVQAIVTRKAILARAALENLHTLTYHFPFPGLGHFQQDGEGFVWKKVKA